MSAGRDLAIAHAVDRYRCWLNSEQGHSVCEVELGDPDLLAVIARVDATKGDRMIAERDLAIARAVRDWYQKQMQWDRDHMAKDVPLACAWLELFKQTDDAVLSELIAVVDASLGGVQGTPSALGGSTAHLSASPGPVQDPGQAMAQAAEPPSDLPWESWEPDAFEAGMRQERQRAVGIIRALCKEPAIPCWVCGCGDDEHAMHYHTPACQAARAYIAEADAAEEGK